jgi:hypothetical protein
MLLCFSEQRTIIPLSSISVIFITETESVYCDVRTEYLNLIRDNFLL